MRQLAGYARGEAGKESDMQPPGEPQVRGGQPGDEELMARAAQFDDAAIAELFDRYGAVALGLARRMLGQARAEDAVQEAFISVWRDASVFDPERGLVRTWLLGIVRSRSLDILRSIAVEDRRQLDLAREQARAALSESPKAALLLQDRNAEVRDAIDALPGDQWEVVELAYFGGWTQVEIAERLGLPLGTVRSRARLALVKLRACRASSVPSV